MMPQQGNMINIMCLFSLMSLFSWESSSFSVVLTTDPPGPTYKAGTLFTIHCSVANGNYSWMYYYYELYYGCTYTGTGTADKLYDYGLGYQIYYNHPIYFATTRPEVCHNIFMCRATEMLLSSYESAVGQLVIETVTDIAIQILPSPYHLLSSLQNASILTVNESGKFLEIVCNSGLKQPNLGKWIHPNGTEITHTSDKYIIERGGGFISLPYSKLRLKDKYSATSQDSGLYTCKMLDVNQVERESHIWILPEQNFANPIPEYFMSHSSTNRDITLKCAYSYTPGNIVWYIGSNVIASDKNHRISQRLLQSSPFPSYEGVLELANVASSIVLDCTIFTHIIGNHANPYPPHDILYEIHYFFLSWIGKQKTFICTFSGNISTIEIYHKGELLKSNTNVSDITYTIDIVKDITHNLEYSCVGKTLNEKKIYTNLSIIALIPEHALVMTVLYTDRVWSEGDSMTLDLIAVKITGFTYDQTITCTDGNNVPLHEIEGVVYPDNIQVAGLTLHLHIKIPSLKLLHAGIYYCKALLLTPPHMDNITHSENFTIKVKVPTPSALLSTESSKNSFKAGSIALFGCSAFLELSSHYVPLGCVFTWSMNGTKLVSNSRYSISQVIISDAELNNDTECYSELQLAPVLKLDESLLLCSVHVVAINTNEFIIPSDMAEFSLSISVEGILADIPISLNFIGLTVPCSQLIQYPENEQFVTNVIVKTITESCDCQYLSSFITNQSLQCHGYESNGLGEDFGHLLYQARVYSTHEIGASIIVEYIQHWVDSMRPNVTFKISNHLNAELLIDRKCQIALNKFNELSCITTTSSIINSTSSMKDSVYITSDYTSLYKLNTSSDGSLSSIVPVSLSSIVPVTTQNHGGTSVMIYSVSALISLCFVIVNCACISLLIAILKRKKAINNGRLTLNSTTIGDPQEFELESEACYTDVASSGQSNLYGLYDNCNGITDIQNRKLPKLPANSSYTKLEEADKIIGNLKLQNSESCSNSRNSDIYTNMDAGAGDKTGDCTKSESSSYIYEELENFQ